MTGYISREAAIEVVCEGCYKVFPEEPCEPSDCIIMQMLRSIPAADVRPVVRGKWLWFGDCSNEGLYCSVCRNKIHEVKMPKKKLSNFCPNCGAVMEES